MRVPLTILVVDDDKSVLLLCRKTLERDGVVVLQAAGSSEALKLVADYRVGIDLIVTDIMLPPPDFQLMTPDNQFPRVNGPGLVDLLVGRGKDLRAVYISASSKADLKARGLNLDDAPFLHKPLTAQTLKDAVQAALTGPPLARQARKPGQTVPEKVDWVG